MGEMKTTVRMHKHPLKSLFLLLKAPTCRRFWSNSVVLEQGDLEHLVSRTAQPHRRSDGAGDRRVPCQTAGDGRAAN
jgi:hypothetical protein